MKAFINYIIAAVLREYWGFVTLHRYLSGKAQVFQGVPVWFLHEATSTLEEIMALDPDDLDTHCMWELCRDELRRRQEPPTL